MSHLRQVLDLGAINHRAASGERLGGAEATLQCNHNASDGCRDALLRPQAPHNEGLIERFLADVGEVNMMHNRPSYTLSGGVEDDVEWSTASASLWGCRRENDGDRNKVDWRARLLVMQSVWFYSRVMYSIQ